MVSYQYSYLIGSLALLLVWLILYLWRKDVRREMLSISVLFGVMGLIIDPIYMMDWWNPLRNLGIESFLFGFVTSGIASVIYEETFNKKIKTKKFGKNYPVKNLNLIHLLTMGFILFFGSIFLLKWSSFVASFPSLFIPTFIIWIKRNDLIKNSLFSGVLLLIVSFLFFIIPELITPGWVESAWRFENLSGILILGAPIEDLIWFFMAGLLIGPLYEYWQEGRLINIKT